MNSMILDSNCEKCINITEDTEITIVGEVHLEHIWCDERVYQLIIRGDVLYVNCPDSNVAIGVPVDRSLSYGRWYMPDSKIRFVIDCREIHTTSGTPGCGIGVYACRSVMASEFTENCVVRDTPVDMCIYNEPLHGSTKHSVDPIYRTANEEAAHKNHVKDVAFKNLGYDKAIPSVTKLMDLLCATICNDDPTPFRDAYRNLLSSLCRALSHVTAEHFAEFVQRIFSSMMRSVIDTGGYGCKSYTIVFSTVGYLCMFREFQLFPKVARLPLSMRYLTVALDAVEEDQLELNNPKQMTSWEEIEMTDELIRYYNHPTDMDYSRECYRSLYGMQYYKWEDYFKDIKEPSAKNLGDMIEFDVQAMPAYTKPNWIPMHPVGKAVPLDWEIWRVASDEPCRLYRVTEIPEYIASFVDLQCVAFALPKDFVVDFLN